MLVSVIIPHFNNLRGLRDSLNSVLAQSYKNIEIIVIDDASRDQMDVWNMGAAFRSQFPEIPITFIFSALNFGPGASRNIGMSSSRGDLVAFLDSGDVWDTQKIEITVEVFKENPTISLLCHGMNRQASDDHLKNEKAHKKNGNFPLRLYPLSGYLLLLRNTIYCSSVTIKRSSGIRFPCWRYCEDLHAWFRFIVNGGQGAKLPMTLGQYYVGLGQGVRLSSNRAKMRKRLLRVIAFNTSSSSALLKIFGIFTCTLKFIWYRVSR